MGQTGSNLIDEQIRLAISGNGTAFTALWDEYIGSLRAYIKGWLTNLDDLYVDDICSRSFEKAFRQISSYDPSRSRFITWLRTIARHTALDLLEQESRIHNVIVPMEDAGSKSSFVDSIDDVDSPLESIIRNEDQIETGKYIERLPVLYREIARKRLLDGLQYKEIAQEMNIELNTVRTRIRRAKDLIEKMRKDDVL